MYEQNHAMDPSFRVLRKKIPWGQIGATELNVAEEKKTF